MIFLMVWTTPKARSVKKNWLPYFEAIFLADDVK
jgi:hypothetical protein